MPAAPDPATGVRREHRYRRSRREPRAPTAFEHRWRWRGGALAGLLAAVAMGAVISVSNLDGLRVAIPRLYGIRGSLVAGWVAHVVHGTLFGVPFDAVLSDPGVGLVGERHHLSVPAGPVYGVVLPPRAHA